MAKPLKRLAQLEPNMRFLMSRIAAKLPWMVEMVPPEHAHAGQAQCAIP